MRAALLLLVALSACGEPTDCGGGHECYRVASLYYDKPDLPNALRFYQKGCAYKHAASCVVAAGMFARAEGTGASPGRSAELRRQACELGDGPACYFLGLELETAEPARAAELFSRGCASSYRPACWNLGRMYEEGRGVASDSDRAFDFYLQSCGGEKVACQSLIKVHGRE